SGERGSLLMGSCEVEGFFEGGVRKELGITNRARRTILDKRQRYHRDYASKVVATRKLIGGYEQVNAVGVALRVIRGGALSVEGVLRIDRKEIPPVVWISVVRYSN